MQSPDARSENNMSTGIIGTGPVGLGLAALLSAGGKGALVWSPNGSLPEHAGSPTRVVASGAIEHEFELNLAGSAEELVGNCDVIIITVPAYGFKNIVGQIAPFLTGGHCVIISSHVPFAAQYLQSKLDGDAAGLLIVALSTTILTGRKSGPSDVTVGSVRDTVEMAVLPVEEQARGLEICGRLFGDRFSLCDNILAIALGNLNPQNHLGIALCNLTRIEKGETWIQAENVTPAVGRLLEKLDEERLAIAAALNVTTRNIFEHFSRSFGVPSGSVATMSRAMVEKGQRGCGPVSLETRYILEDVPYGLVPTVWFGKVTGVPVPLHQAGVDLFGALCDRDFFSMNEMMNELKATAGTDDGLLALAGGHL
jgi:opine dehydrogenase